MKDEIKELLDYFKKYVNDKYETYTVVDIHTQNLKTLLNYITNLQERIEKAIEYIMTELITEWDIENDGCVSGSDLPVYAITPILNLLQGEDKE